MQRKLIGLALVSWALSSCGNAQASQTLIPALEKLAAQDNAEAVYHLGMAYQTGAGLPKDSSKAFEAFRRAAELGDVLASYKLGCFYDGQGAGLVQDDPELALRYKLVAAEAGYALAQQDVAALYAAREEFESAVSWLENAMEQGWPDALATYASVHNGANGIEPDPVKAAAYFRIYIDRTDGSVQQREWLSDFERKLSPDEKRRVEEVVDSYRAAPNAITVRALSGQRAAEALISRP